MTHNDEQPLDGTTHHAAAADAQDFVQDDPMIGELGVALRAALAPRAGLRDTARHKVDRALQSRSGASGLISMGGCAIDTLRHLLTNPTQGADRYSMSRTRQRTDTLDQSGSHARGDRR